MLSYRAMISAPRVSSTWNTVLRVPGLYNHPCRASTRCLTRPYTSPTSTRTPAKHTMATPAIALNDGTSIPFLAYGSGTALFKQDASKFVTAAIEAGFRHIDTAQMYQNEEYVGAGIKAAGVPREQLYITTKLGPVPAGKTVRDTLVESLSKLQVDSVDLFLIHMPNQHEDLKATWKAFEELKKEGLTKSIGVSNFQPQHLKEVLEVATIPPAVNQVRTVGPPCRIALMHSAPN